MMTIKIILLRKFGIDYYIGLAKGIEDMDVLWSTKMG